MLLIGLPALLENITSNDLKENSMYKTVSFKKKLLATLVASSALGLSSFAFAQEEADEVVVTGIKASLTAAMDIKRDAVGVVDAISAEDIGKMPDSNLAESLQRITGVSISRNNGEGSQVTVRGIDPALNMITLNGRVMPAVSQGQTGDNASRAYDFSNLASESISGVDVFKTGKANVAGGGLGASINIKTLRPLEAGNKATFGAKAVQDESTRFGKGTGADYTPEVSGLYSWVNEEDNFGVALNASHQERNSSRSNVFVNAWQLKTAGDATYEDKRDPVTGNIIKGTATNGAKQLTSDGTLPVGLNTGLKKGDLYALPTDLRYQVEDISRTRENAQLTLQFKPIESLTGTVDYTYSENEITSSRSQQSTWYNIDKISKLTFDNGVVKSPLIYQETYPDGGKDVSFAQEEFDTKTTSNSFGVNLAWEATDSLKFNLDYHNSSAESVTNDVQAGLNANVVTANYVDFSKEVPVMGIKFNDTANGNGNQKIDGADVSGAMGTISRGLQRTEVEELQLSGSYALGDLGFITETTVDFGLADRSNSNHSISGNGGDRITMGNWGGVNPKVFGGDFAGYFTARDFGSSFPDASSSTGDSNFLHTGLIANVSDVASKIESLNTQALTAAKFGIKVVNKDDPSKTDDSTIWLNGNDAAGQAAVAKIMADTTTTDLQKAQAIATLKPTTTQLNPDNFNGLPNGKFVFNGKYNVNRLVEEDVSAFYVQFKGAFDVAGLPAHALVGVRYETTDVTSIGSINEPTGLQWDSDNDWTLQTASGAAKPVIETTSYNNLLPNIDLDVSPTDDVKVRLSYSETMGRASYQNLAAVTGIDSVYNRTASRGIPGLKPMESQNLDLSAEWYYNDNSYVSLGVFSKKVTNFIGSSITNEHLYNLYDPRTGDRMDEAKEDLIAAGKNPNDEKNQWEQILKNAGVGSPKEGQDKIYGDATKGDDLANWNVSQPNNGKDATIDGVEVGVQHFFGESGFGIQANYTAVSSDAEFNIGLNSAATQFALIGVSDSANIVGIYEKNGFQARLAYNWRDAFLNSTNQSGNNEPSFTKAFGTVDLSLGYEVNDNVSITLEGLNILGENSLNYGRSETQVNSYEDLSARYTAGIRYTF